MLNENGGCSGVIETVINFDKGCGSAKLKKSPNDEKAYRPITLPNGMRVLLVENRQSMRAAAALAVNVGHFDDPTHRQGLAHFLEHMLFLGTEKYPDGSEYQKFISAHGGSNNAWTAAEHTCFFFDIQQKHFTQALDRFSQFFISPLLSEEFIEKERENIDAEFKLKLKDDIRRLYDVHKATINANHPFSKFSVGTSHTLRDIDGVSIAAEVRDFFEQNYCASQMTLVIESANSLDELETLAHNYFGEVKNRNISKKAINEPLYLPNNQAQFIFVEPVKNDRQLIISFAMPSIDKYYKEKPESILAYLLGHEGKGSILSLLKAKQWALGLTAGSGVNGSNFKDFNISMPLTPEGELHIDEIISLIFSYINLIKTSQLAEHYYQDKKAIAELSFTYQEKMSPLDNVCQLVINMQHYPVEDYVYGDYVMSELNLDYVNALLDKLTPENMRVVHISHQVTTDKISKWYQVPYAQEPFTSKQMRKWQTPLSNEQLYLPGKNPYIVATPKVLSLENEAHSAATGKAPIPELIRDENGISVWFKQDQTFRVPKGYLYVGLDSPITIASTENIAMTRLFVDIYSEAIVEEHYDAELAGIHYHLYSHQGGLSLQLSGLSEKQGELLKTLLASLKQVSLDKARFDLIKKQLLLHWKNADKSKSISQLFSVLSSALQPSNPSAVDMHNALEQVTFERFVNFAGKIFTDVSLKILVHGNWHKHHALAMSDTILQALNEQSDIQHHVEVPLIDMTGEGEVILPLVLEDHDHAAVAYYPLASKSPNAIARTIVTSQLFSPHFFQKMRTEKQFGYLVGVGYVPIHQYPGLAFYIQSPNTPAITLIEAINAFIENHRAIFDKMSEGEWQHLKQGLAGQLQEKDTSLRIRSQRFWAAICNNDELFNHKQQVIDALLSMELSDIVTFVEDHLLPSAAPDRINLVTFADQASSEKITLNGRVFKKIENITHSFKRKT